MTQFPENEAAYPIHYQGVLKQASAGGIMDAAYLDQWWAFFDHQSATLSEDILDRIWALTLATAEQKISDKRPEDAEVIISPTLTRWPDNYAALAILAQASELRSDWASATSYWQLMAAKTNPITAKTLAHVAQKPDELLHQSEFARRRLTMVRFRLANELHAAGKTRASSELVTRAIEALPDQQMLKSERPAIEAVSAYVRDALAEDGVKVANQSTSAGCPLKIAFVLDALDLTDNDGTAASIFAFCRTLLGLDDNIEIHVILTNERFAVTTPIVQASFDAKGAQKLQSIAKKNRAGVSGSAPLRTLLTRLRTCRRCR